MKKNSVTKTAERKFNSLLLPRSREAINKLMTKKFNDIIIHYGKEVEKMEAIFNAFKDKPPIYKNHPPGAWGRRPGGQGRWEETNHAEETMIDGTWRV